MHFSDSELYKRVGNVTAKENRPGEVAETIKRQLQMLPFLVENATAYPKQVLMSGESKTRLGEESISSDLYLDRKLGR